MAFYPDWVMKYKGKGIYIKKTKNGYSLYRGHSERVKGKRWPVLKCDEYLGLVTKEDGLIPSRPPVRKDVIVKTYGIEYIAEKCCSSILRESNTGNRLLYEHALLSLKKEDNSALYSMSILSYWYGDSKYDRVLSSDEETAIQRLKEDIKAAFERIFDKDTEEAIELLGGVYAVFVNGRWVISNVSGRLYEILLLHGEEIKFEEKALER